MVPGEKKVVVLTGRTLHLFFNREIDCYNRDGGGGIVNQVPTL